MPKVVAEYKAQARDRILQTASDLFRHQGFRSTTMDDIAHQLGVSKGAIYLYFQSKNELLSVLQERMRHGILERWNGLLEEGDIAEGIVSSLDQIFNGEVSPSIWHELMAASSGDPQLRKLMQDDAREDRRAMEQFLRRLQRRGRISQARNSRELADVILLIIQGSVAELMMGGRGSETRKQLIRSLQFVLGPAGSLVAARRARPGRPTVRAGSARGRSSA